MRPIRAGDCRGLCPNTLNPTRPFDVATDEPIMASVAGRYASALFELAEEQRQLSAVETHLDAFQQLLDASEDLRRLIRSPVFSSEEQLAAISAVLERVGIDGLAANFLKLAARNRRLFAVPDMIKAFRAMCARARGEVEAEVTSAFPLKDEQMRLLKESLRGKVGKDVKVRAKVDPALLGGLIVKIGSRMIDSSLRTKLNSLKTRMKEVG
jgi:F-type H+-transporting ATPase subunit delta